jgi:DNA-binding transcriptional ArsR family regulator
MALDKEANLRYINIYELSFIHSNTRFRLPVMIVRYPRRSSLKGVRTTEKMARIFKVLSDPTRLLIVQSLEVGERCVQNLAADAGLSQSLVSHHLRTLRDLNLVNCRRQGKQSFYSLADAHVFALLAVARDHSAENARVIHE